MLNPDEESDDASSPFSFTTNRPTSLSLESSIRSANNHIRSRSSISSSRRTGSSLALSRRSSFNRIGKQSPFTGGSSTSLNLDTSRSSLSTVLSSVREGGGIAAHESKAHVLPRRRISKKHMANKKLIQIAIRRKVTKRPKQEESPSSSNGNSKLHIKYLEAGLRAKLMLAPSIFSLYNSLISKHNRNNILLVSGNDVFSQETKTDEDHHKSKNKTKLNGKSFQLIDNNLVDLSGYSNKILQTLNLSKAAENEKTKNAKNWPTFNSMDTAVRSLFGITEYTLVRVTRSASKYPEGSAILKLETARPGDFSLIDDFEFTDEFVHSIGKINEAPDNLFIKKLVARPRYKSDMKIFLVPQIDNISIYIDARMLERDLINGVIDHATSFYNKSIYSTFDFNPVIEEYKKLANMSALEEMTESNND